MFAGMGVDPLTEVFAAQLVPFRSRSWNALPNREAALARSLELWRWLLPRSPARLFLSLGKRPGVEVANLLGAEHQVAHPVGWGAQTIDEYVDGDGRIVLAMPHLSRFRLFGTGRPQATKVITRAASQALAPENQ